MRRAKLITLIGMAFLVIVFVLQNTESVNVRFLFFEFNLPKTTLFLILLLAGFIVGVIAGQRSRRQRNSQPKPEQ